MENSPLGRIPSEIRNQIYQWALYEPNGIRLRPQNKKYAYWSEMGEKSSLRDAVRLLAVCRQMRTETHGYYFEANAVRVEIAKQDPDFFDAAPWSDRELSTLSETFPPWFLGPGAPLLKPKSATICLTGYDLPKLPPRWESLQKAINAFGPSVPISMQVLMAPWHSFEWGNRSRTFDHPPITFGFGRKEEAVRASNAFMAWAFSLCVPTPGNPLDFRERLDFVETATTFEEVVFLLKMWQARMPEAGQS